MKKWMSGFGLLCLASAVFADQTPAVPYQWSEFAPNHQLLQRIITTESSCSSKNMQITNASNANFPITICQKTLPVDPAFSARRIVIIGDTGCRLKKGVNPQDCDNPKKWPFSTIAESAAAWKPDLVIHVGDYLYREVPCPAGDKQCAGSPHGDNWATWQADFFKPARPLLSAAPWIFVRGNHETCKRAGEGWTRLLDPFNFKHCHDYSPVYSVDIGNTRLFIIDSANANDYLAPTDQTSWYENYLQEVNQSKAKYNWIITHKPFWFVYSEDELHQAVQSHFLNTLQTAWLNVLPSNISLLLSGHVHRFQVLNLSDKEKYPPQLIAGNGGTRLDQQLVQANLTGINIAGENITQGISLNDYGFVTMEKHDTNSWSVQLHNPHGKVIIDCLLQNQQLSCHSPKI
jgi:hypothetical protein